MKKPAHLDVALHESLLATADLLSRRRAGEIAEQTIDQLVAMRWLTWKGGALRLTEAGEGVLVKAQATMLDNLRAA